MPEFPNTRLLAVTILMVLVMAGCAPAPKASDSGYYAVNPDGEIYTDGKGNCWHITTREKTESDLRAECGDEISQPAMEEDSDGDGVPDSRDRCPNTPRGTQVDADGCPIEKQAPIVLKGVTFKFDSAELTAQAENRLDNVVNALQASTDLDFSIDGYTDSIGTEAYNQDLSQRRVDSVQEYLTSNGIDSGRITSTRGHGESDPVATNETTAGRAQNRRVELHVTGQ